MYANNEVGDHSADSRNGRHRSPARHPLPHRRRGRRLPRSPSMWKALDLDFPVSLRAQDVCPPKAWVFSTSKKAQESARLSQEGHQEDRPSGPALKNTLGIMAMGQGGGKWAMRDFSQGHSRASRRCGDRLGKGDSSRKYIMFQVNGHPEKRAPQYTQHLLRFHRRWNLCFTCLMRWELPFQQALHAAQDLSIHHMCWTAMNIGIEKDSRLDPHQSGENIQTTTISITYWRISLQS